MIRSFHIEPVLNGYIVTIGCQKVVFESIAGLMRATERYLSEPAKVEEEFWSTSLNSKHLVGQQPAQPPIYGGAALGRDECCTESVPTPTPTAECPY